MDTLQRHAKSAGCLCNPVPTPGDACFCSPTERGLRAIKAGASPYAMTAAERDWCLEQVRAVEGWDDHPADDPDDYLARAVLCAWLDFCRDKGLL